MLYRGEDQDVTLRRPVGIALGSSVTVLVLLVLFGGRPRLPEEALPGGRPSAPDVAAVEPEISTPGARAPLPEARTHPREATPGAAATPLPQLAKALKAAARNPGVDFVPLAASHLDDPTGDPALQDLSLRLLGDRSPWDGGSRSQLLSRLQAGIKDRDQRSRAYRQLLPHVALEDAPALLAVLRDESDLDLLSLAKRHLGNNPNPGVVHQADAVLGSIPTPSIPSEDSWVAE